MFEDKRSKRLVLVAHCLLNQNSISDATVELPSQFEEVIDLIMANKTGIIQLPCPELSCLGLIRRDKEGGKRDLLQENTRIRALMQGSGAIQLLKKKAEEVAEQIVDYLNYDFTFLGLIGINRSPSCGVETTSMKDQETAGKGVFVELIQEEFRRRNIPLRMLGVKASRKQESVDRVQEFLKG